MYSPWRTKKPPSARSQPHAGNGRQVRVRRRGCRPLASLRCPHPGRPVSHLTQAWRLGQSQVSGGLAGSPGPMAEQLFPAEAGAKAGICEGLLSTLAWRMSLAGRQPCPPPGACLCLSRNEPKVDAAWSLPQCRKTLRFLTTHTPLRRGSGEARCPQGSGGDTGHRWAHGQYHWCLKQRTLLSGHQSHQGRVS